MLCPPFIVDGELKHHRSRKGDKQKIRNYRPFSLKYVISNILESVTQGATAGHLDKGKKIKGETVLYQFARDL